MFEFLNADQNTQAADTISPPPSSARAFRAVPATPASGAVRNKPVRRPWRTALAEAVSQANVTASHFLGAPRLQPPHPRTPRFGYVYVPDWTYEGVMRLIVQDGATALLLEGAHGGGKSDLAAFIAMMLGRELEIITFDGQVDVGDLMGRWVLQQGEMVWRDGKIPRAMKSGAILRVDEINAAPAEINIVFNDIADGKPYYSREADELIVPDPGFRLIGTMNPHLEYAGTHALNAATLDRFTRVEVRYPSKAMERTRLRLNFPSIRDEDLDVLLDLAERNREQKANDPSREYVISPRALVKTCRQMEHANFSLADAIRYGIIEKAAYFGAEIADALKADVTAMIAARAQQP